MIKQRRNGTAWLWGMAVASLLWVVVFTWFKPCYHMCDDTFILRTFMGNAPSGAPDFHAYVSFLYAYPLRWLNQLFPNVAWFSVVQIALLWLATVTIVKSIMQCFWRAGHGSGTALTVSLCFTGLYVFACFTRPTYTITAGLLVAAAAAQLISIDCQTLSDRAIIGRSCYALLLVALCHGLRQLGLYPALLYCGIAFLYLFFTCFRRARSIRPLIAILITVAAVIGVLLVGRESEIIWKNQQSHVEWQQARTNAHDYMNLYNVPAEGFESLGWSEAQADLFINWYTMDEIYATDAMTTLYEQYHETAPLSSAYDAIVALFRFDVLCQIGALVLLGGLILLMARRSGLWTALAVLCAGAGCAALVVYLAIGGRLPYRALMLAVLPAAAILFCLLSQVFPKKRIACLLLAALTLVYLVPQAQSVFYQPPQWDYDAFEDMDIQANAHPDYLFIYGNDLSQDLRMFPDTPLPTNLMFWGGWSAHSPEYRDRLMHFGIDPDHFTAEDWLRPCVRYLTLRNSEFLDALLAYLRQALGNVQYEQTQLSDGLFAYRFYLE